MRNNLWLLVTFLFIGAQAQTFEDKCKERIDLGETPALAIAFYENGKTTFFSYGQANIATQDQVSSKTLFEIGSITKVFTCSMLSHYVINQEVNLDDPAKKYLPATIWLPEKNGKAISLAHLATAHSGLPRLPGNLSPVNPADPYVDYTEKELTNFFNNYELSREPGKQYEYSNLGMGTLGYILTRKANSSYAKILKEIILEPMGMKNTFVSGQEKSKFLATGYVDKNPVKAWTWTDKSTLTGAGGIVSNTEDMIKFMIAQLSPDETPLIKAFKLAHAERTDAGSPEMKIGLGWHIRDHKYVWHNGGTGGFRSFAGFDPEKKRAIVILTNSTSSVDDLGFHWLNPAYQLKVVKKSINLTEDILNEYVGVYEISPQFKLAITRDGSSLMVQATNQPKISIYAEAKDQFFLKIVEAKITFSRNTEGKVEKLVLMQNGAVLEGKKIE